MAQLLENKLTVDLLDGKEVSEQEYLDIYMEYPDVSFEYVDGRLRRLEVSINKIIAMGHFLSALLFLYFENNSYYLKTLFSQHNYSTKMGKLKNNYRKPDYMVVDKDYDPNDNKVYNVYIAIELVSLGHEKYDKKDKKKEYKSKGISYYIIINKTVEKSKFYQLNTKQEYEDISLKQDDIVELVQYKGLKFRLSDLFAIKDVETLSKDPLYKHSFGYLRNIGKAEGIKIGKAEGIKIGEEKGIKIGKAEGIKIGEEKGIKIGEEKGIKIGEEKGIKIGEKKGREEEKYKMLRKMKSTGMNNEMIQNITGLSLKEIEQL